MLKLLLTSAVGAENADTSPSKSFVGQKWIRFGTIICKGPSIKDVRTKSRKSDPFVLKMSALAQLPSLLVRADTP